MDMSFLRVLKNDFSIVSILITLSSTSATIRLEHRDGDPIYVLAEKS